MTIIVARARNGVIGAQDKMPWHLPEELQHFKTSTLGHAVLMGRKTFDSIGKPLPGRRIIVVSRNVNWHHPECEHANSLDAAVALCTSPHPLVTNTKQIFVAGGAQLYIAAMPKACRLLITEIDLAPSGDVHFPDPDLSGWTLTSSTAHQSSNGVAYSIQDWRRTEKAEKAQANQ